VTGDRTVVRQANVEGLLRELAPQVLGALIRRFGTFGTAEDAVQEALLAAAVQWPADGIPDNPRGWLVTAASRRLTDQLRSDCPPSARLQAARSRLRHGCPPADTDVAEAATDDTSLLFPVAIRPSPPSQPALTLRAVGGLTTEQIARAFLVPDATNTADQPAKQTIRAAGGRLECPLEPEAVRLQVVMRCFT
jgi:predicted RNA polymerase sigma factor